jgi:hypothetical protein
MSHQRIAFLHIPKTAGVSVIDSFVNRFGADLCAPFSNKISDKAFECKNFISGHIYLGDIECDAFLFTFVRNPLKQIASHLMWIDHYNQPEYEAEFLGFSDDLKRCIRQLASADFSSARSIDKYLQWLPRDSDLRVINLQSELLAFKRQGVVEVGPKELADRAINNLARLKFVGVSENFANEMKTLFEILNLGSSPVVSHLNSSPSARRIDITLPDIKGTLSKYVEADLRLYEHILDMKENPTRAKRNLTSIFQFFARKHKSA